MKIKLIILFILVIFLGVFLQINDRDTRVFSSSVEECNRVDQTERFSCFRSSLDNFFKKNEEKGLKSFMEIIEEQNLSFDSDDNSYAIFGTNCHTYYHAVGDLLATYRGDEDIESTLGLCPLSCTSACMMGFFKRTAIAENFSSETLSTLYGACRDEELKSCSHEVGHLLHDKYTTSILQTLDRISSEKFGLLYNMEYLYKTYDAVDLNKPFEDCRKLLPEDRWNQCFTGIGHNLFLFSEFSTDGYKGELNNCMENSNAQNREECLNYLVFRIGINEVAPRFLSSKFDEGNDICEEVSDYTKNDHLLEHCYIGLGGGIGLFVESELSGKNATWEDKEVLGEELKSYAKLCEGALDYRESCFAGLLGTKFKDYFGIIRFEYEPFEEMFKNTDSNFRVIGFNS